MAKGGRTHIPGSPASTTKRSSGAKTGQRVDVAGAPKSVNIPKATVIKKGFRIPGSKARGK